MTASALNVTIFVRPVENMAVKNALKSISQMRKQDYAANAVRTVMNVPQKLSAQNVLEIGSLIKPEPASNVMLTVRIVVSQDVINVKTLSTLMSTQDYVIDVAKFLNIVISVLIVTLVLNVKLLSSLKMNLVKLVVKPVQPVKIEMPVLTAKTRTAKIAVQMPVLNVLITSSI